MKQDVTINLFPEKIVCKDDEDFNIRMIMYIAGTEKAFIPQKPDLIDREDLRIAMESAKEENAKFLVPSVVSAHSSLNKTFKPYIILMSDDHKMFMFPYNGDGFSDKDKKKW